MGRFVLLSLVDLQAFLNEAAGILEVARGGFVAPIAFRFAFRLTDNAEVLGGGGKAPLILQIDGELPRLLIPGSRLGQAAGFTFDQAEEIIGPHDGSRVTCPEPLEWPLVEACGAVELVSVIREDALML